MFTTLLFKVLKCQLRKRVHFLAEIFTKYPTLTGSLDIIDIDFWNGQFHILKVKPVRFTFKDSESQKYNT